MFTAILGFTIISIFLLVRKNHEVMVVFQNLRCEQVWGMILNTGGSAQAGVHSAEVLAFLYNLGRTQTLQRPVLCHLGFRQ